MNEMSLLDRASHFLWYILRILLELISTYRTLLKEVKQQKLFLNIYVRPSIDTLLLTHPIERKVIDKLYKYYGLGVPAMLGLLYALPRGYTIDHQERLALTYVGALTGLVDDAFDEGLMDTANVLAYMQSPDTFKPVTGPEHLLAFLGGQVLKLLPKSHKEDFMRLALDIFTLQVESVKQKDPSLDLVELHQITRSKGGLPFVLYRYCLKDKMPNEEEQLVFEIGASMQLGNDLFDVYKDLNDHIYTIPNRSQNLDELQNLLKDWMHQVLMHSKKVWFVHETDRHKLAVYFLLGMSRCFVCLDQFKLLSKTTLGSFSPQQYSRKQLICDMEKPINVWRSIRWYYTLKKEFGL
jgi:hypothetical protein